MDKVAQFPLIFTVSFQECHDKENKITVFK